MRLNTFKSEMKIIQAQRNLKLRNLGRQRIIATTKMRKVLEEYIEETLSIMEILSIRKFCFTGRICPLSIEEYDADP